MRRLTIAVCLAAGLAMPAGASAGAPETALRGALERQMRPAGSGSGALVVDLTAGRTLYGRRPDVARIPASNQKLYTTAVALLRMGAADRLTTRVFGDGALGEDGTYDGSLYLRGGGDPTFGTAAFNRRAYGFTGASVEALADRVAELGIVRVRGGVYGDETQFDRLRGGPDSGYAFSYYLGAPLSALSFNRGLANTRGTARQTRPAAFAAAQLARALRERGVAVGRSGGERATPPAATPLTSVASPPLATLARMTNVPSDNFFAEMLLKGLGARFGGRGSTATGASVARVRLAAFGIRPRIADGSGLSRSNRTTPRHLVTLLAAMEREPVGRAFRDSLAVACASGTLAGRMCRTRASGRCRGKTGTLSGVSALAGLCVAGKRTIAFAILMNGVNVTAARRRQDRMAAAIAAYRPAAGVSRRVPAG